MMEKLQIILVGVLGTFFAWVFDNGDAMYNYARWIPLLASTAYVIWKWRKDYKKEK